MNEEARILRDKEHDARMAETKIAIQNEKMKALTDIKNEIALLSIDVAEKILSEELSTQTKQEEMISKWVNELNLN